MENTIEKLIREFIVRAADEYDTAIAGRRTTNC